MNEAIAGMLARYQPRSARDYENALKEILQELVLLALWRAKFFEKAAFYGGTALRILYGLDRFSEDLDFSLIEPEAGFKLDKYHSAVRAELESFGFKIEIESRRKAADSAIESAFLKATTRDELIKIEVPAAILDRIQTNQVLKIKFEVDVDPPGDFSTEARPLLQPIPFYLRVFKPEDLFAGKTHAILCRKWKTRVKGRDWYDLLWYVSRGTPIGVTHLKSRLVQSGAWAADRKLAEQDVKKLFQDKIDQVDFETAAEDVQPFIKDPAATEVWSKDFFRDIVGRIQYAN